MRKNVGTVLLSGFAGTSAMTLFSYAISKIREKSFLEPELLAALLKNGRCVKRPGYAGWLLHYLLGTGWALVEASILKALEEKKEPLQIGYIGAVSGISGVLTWKLAFSIHSCPPNISYKNYYGHLLLAHFVYTWVVIRLLKTLPQ